MRCRPNSSGACRRRRRSTGVAGRSSTVAPGSGDSGMIGAITAARGRRPVGRSRVGGGGVGRSCAGMMVSISDFGAALRRPGNFASAASAVAARCRQPRSPQLHSRSAKETRLPFFSGVMLVARLVPSMSSTVPVMVSPSSSTSFTKPSAITLCARRRTVASKTRSKSSAEYGTGIG